MPEFQCRILTPTREFFSGGVFTVTFTTADGQIEILSGHESLVAPVHVGVLKLRVGVQDRYAAVTEGFARVKNGKLDIFVDAAEWPEEIDLPRAKESLERAQKRLEEAAKTTLTYRARSSLDRARNRVRVAELGKARA